VEGGQRPHRVSREPGSVRVRHARGPVAYRVRRHGPRSDSHRLDADGDGVACDSNPAPYYRGKTLPGGGGGDDSRPRRTTGKAIVIRVVDGDTVTVRVAGRQKTVRLIGIDTPEVYFGVECGGPAASRSLKKRLPKGTRVRRRLGRRTGLRTLSQAIN
jgi:endonuclease YncB( thermonuclease family)